MLTLLAATLIATAPLQPDALFSRPYTDVRAELLASGWQAPQSKECAASDWTVQYFCEEFPEVQYCSPTGFLVCHFVLTREGETIHIYTRGEDEDMLVENVSDAPIKGSIIRQ